MLNNDTIAREFFDAIKFSFLIDQSSTDSTKKLPKKRKNTKLLISGIIKKQTISQTNKNENCFLIRIFVQRQFSISLRSNRPCYQPRGYPRRYYASESFVQRLSHGRIYNDHPFYKCLVWSKRKRRTLDQHLFFIQKISIIFGKKMKD